MFAVASVLEGIGSRRLSFNPEGRGRNSFLGPLVEPPPQLRGMRIQEKTESDLDNGQSVTFLSLS